MEARKSHDMHLKAGESRKLVVLFHPIQRPKGEELKGRRRWMFSCSIQALDRLDDSLLC
jgi:hypothetical protein